MAEKNAREILIEKFLIGYKITREDWIKLLTNYALASEAGNVQPATIEQVFYGTDNEKFITSFLLDYFWKNKILGNSPDNSMRDFSTVAHAIKSLINDDASGNKNTWSAQQIKNKIAELITDNSTNTENTWSSQKIKQYVDDSEMGMLTYKGQVANIAALNAIVDPKVGDTYNVLGNGNGANFAWSGTVWDELGMHIIVDSSPTQNSTNPVSGGGVLVELNKKIDKSNITNDLATGGATNVLSAEMGKWLQENKLSNQITFLGSGNSVNMQNLSMGVYNFGVNANINGHPFFIAQAPNNLIVGYGYILIVFANANNSRVMYIYQINNDMPSNKTWVLNSTDVQTNYWRIK